MSVNDYNGRLAIREDINGAAWHGLGGFSGEQTAEFTMDKFSDGIPFFSKQLEFFQMDDGKMVPTGDYKLVRHPTKDDRQYVPMGSCTKSYRIVQPTDIAQAFDERVAKPVETLGFLGRGEKMFLTWEMPRSIVVRGDDETKLFGTILAGFDAKVAISLSLMSFRVVCQNTFNMAQGVVKREKSKDGSKGRVWTGRHNSPNILRDLSAWMEHIQLEAEKQVELAEGFFNKLVATPIDKKNVLKSLIEEIYPLPAQLGSYPKELRGEKEQRIQKAYEKAKTDQEELEKLFFGGDPTTTGGTAYDLFQNVTYYENHIRASKKDTANSIAFGNRMKTMNDAMAVLIDYSNER